MTSEHQAFLNNTHNSTEQVLAWYIALDDADITRPLLTQLFRQHSTLLSKIDHPLVDDALIDAVFESHTASLFHLPKNKMTKSLAFQYIASAIDKRITGNFRIETFNHLFNKIPSRLLTSDFVSRLHSKSKCAQHFPDKFAYGIIWHLTDAIKSEALCQAAFRYRKDCLKVIPDVYITPDMCIQAIADFPYQLEAIPKNLMTKKICREALSKGNGRAALHLPNVDDWNEAFIFSLIKQYAGFINQVPVCHLRDTVIVYSLREAARQNLNQNKVTALFLDLPKSFRDHHSVQDEFFKIGNPVFLEGLMSHLNPEGCCLLSDPSILKKWNTFMLKADASAFTPNQLKNAIKQHWVRPLRETLSDICAIKNTKVLDEMIEFVSHVEQLGVPVKSIIKKIEKSFEQQKTIKTSIKVSHSLSL